MTIRLGSGGPYEAAFGYSRVVRTGPLAVTAGCTSVLEGVVQHPGDAHQQALTAFRTGLEALARVGAAVTDVVSTRMYIVDAALADDVGRAHGMLFGAAPPAATMVVVAGFVDRAMLVEVELVAWVGESASPRVGDSDGAGDGHG